MNLGLNCRWEVAVGVKEIRGNQVATTANPKEGVTNK